MPGIEQQVINEMVRVTKPGGKIIVRVFSENIKDAQGQNYKRLGLTEIQDDGTAVTTAEGFYSRRFSKEQLSLLFKGTGLNYKIEEDGAAAYVVTVDK